MITRDDYGNPRLPKITTQLPPRAERDFVTSEELLTATGISYRQLDYWCRTSLIAPLTPAMPGSGYYRVFDQLQVDRARHIRILLAAGISLQTIREHIDEITTTGQVVIGEITITIHPSSGDAA